MSEGLFYKKIREQDYLFNETESELPKILGVLDEAKQDFPHRKLMYVTPEMKIGSPKVVEAIPIRCYDCSEIKAWKEKWFGSAIEKER